MNIMMLRKNMEDLVQKDFAGANKHLLGQQKSLKFMHELEGKSKKEIAPLIRDNIDINKMLLYNSFFNGIDIQEKIQERIIDEITPRVEEKRQALSKAMQKRRTLEILKEREWLKRQKELSKREIALLDEVAANQWQRRQ